MIAAKTLRLIRRVVGTAAVTAVVAVLVVIYLRSEGNGTGALAPVPRTSASRSTGGERGSSSNGSSGNQGGSGSAGSGSCEPPRICSSQGSGAGGSSSPGGSSTTATYAGRETPYGPVQVAVAEERGKIVDVKALQLPTEHALSQEISEQVAEARGQMVPDPGGP